MSRFVGIGQADPTNQIADAIPDGCTLGEFFSTQYRSIFSMRRGEDHTFPLMSRRNALQVLGILYPIPEGDSFSILGSEHCPNSTLIYHHRSRIYEAAS